MGRGSLEYAVADHRERWDEASAFETLVAELSTRLANASALDIADGIDSALRRLVAVTGYDRCTYGEFGVDGLIHVVRSAAAEGIAPVPSGAFGRDLRWYTGELRAGRIVTLPDLPNGLPPEAAEEAALIRTIGLRSQLSIPLRVGGRVTGVLAFAGLRRSRHWPAATVRRLTLVGELIAGASARARLEEETQQLRSRVWHADRVSRTGVLTGAIAHEINQPLAAILGNAQAGLALLDRGNADPERLRAILEAVAREDKRAADTIASIRALLRHDDSDRQPIDVAGTVAEILHLLGSDLRRQGVRVHTSLPPGCFVMANRVQIEQVVLNLVFNAVEAMQAVPRHVRALYVAALPEAPGHVTVAVEDAGPGVPAEHRDMIFEPFWTTRNEGLGLGLAICRSIVAAHAGTIAAEGNALGGTTFLIRLPACTAPAGTAETSASARPAAPALQRAGERSRLVCIVDDDPGVREALTRLLDACGCAAVAFASGQALLERWPIADAGCVLLDLRLPAMSGLELHRRLTTLGPVPPVIFMTGHGDVASGVEAMKAGAVDFLAKPVEREVLVGAVQKAFALGDAARRHGVERERSRSLLARLSPRERDVTVQVIRGRLNKQIAAHLGISEQTVKQHRGRVMAKLEVRSVADLVRLCELAGGLGVEDHPVRARSDQSRIGRKRGSSKVQATSPEGGDP